MSNYIASVLISLVPGFVMLARVAGRVSSAWLAAAVGGGGWLLALVLRVPLLVLLQNLTPGIIYLVAASVLAGVFEESIRSLVLRAAILKSGRGGSLALGLGWGLTEALLVYAVPVSLSASVYGYDWVDLLPGALERNSAILIHLSLTVLLSKNPRSYRLLATSATLHSVSNLVAIVASLVLENIWLVELVIAMVSALLFVGIAMPMFKAFKKSYSSQRG
ncbi:MAG: hypothetical protein QW741_04105 [Sulfolobales archaeon]